MQQSYQAIKRLVADFKAQEAAYLSPGYQESQVRQDFIDKFFTALGWDVTHVRQKNPYEQEVHIENKVKMSGSSQRRADYAFFLSPNFRDPKFFVEAKKPSRNLANADDYYQAIRYGWNAKTPLVILTDFEEFHVLDCRFKPNIEEAMSRKVETFHYSDYAVEDKFARIYYLFSREAVAGGSIEKRATELPRPRGKAGQKGSFKGGYQAVDEAFLEELDEYRITLAKAFKKANEKLEGEELTEAVQRTIDRLVFIRFLEDKGIEEKAIINLKGQKSAWKAFISLCKRHEPKYNGLVFKPHHILDAIVFEPMEDELFADICEELADPASPYDFNQIPISILGSIYERFLGKVVHATDKRVKVEDKPEVRKAGGVYYTPEYIVRYIVKETVGKLIEGKTPAEIVPMAFADIACGSGSFLIEVYAQLLDYHVRYYLAHPDKAKPDDVFERDGKLQLTLKKKKEILLNNIYGVDLDFQATEVTQLSLYLKLLEDATMNDAHQFGLFKETILPDLKQSIVCGNSLIGRDIIDGTLFSNVDESKLKPMNFADAFPRIMKKSGFDAVVGNPPYLKIEHISEIDRTYFAHRYKSFFKRYDTYGLFVERAAALLRPDGLLGMIIPSTMLNNLSFSSLRKLLLDTTTINRITNLGGKVFQNVNNDTIILLFTKGAKRDAGTEVFDVRDYGAKIDTATLSAKLNLSEVAKAPQFAFELRVSDALEQLISKLNRVSVKLESVCSSFQGFVTGGNDAYIVDEATIRKEKLEKEICKPAVFGDNVKRFDVPRVEYFVIYLTKELSLTDYPNIRKRLEPFRTTLQRKREVRIGRQPWFSLHWPRVQRNFERQEKILVQAIRNLSLKRRIIATLDTQKLYADHTLNVIFTDDAKYSLKYILGVLNSSLMNHVFANKYIDINIKGVYLMDIPVRSIDFSDLADKARHDHIANLVEQMLEGKQKLVTAKTDAEVNRHEQLCSSLDRQIDEAVYELYGLTEEEIKIVEGK